jgi:hypothetical protein
MFYTGMELNFISLPAPWACLIFPLLVAPNVFSISVGMLQLAGLHWLKN